MLVWVFAFFLLALISYIFYKLSYKHNTKLDNETYNYTFKIKET